MSHKDGRIRKNVMVGGRVQIVLKQDQGSGRITKGIVADILTDNPKHPHGIEVCLTSGKTGRIKKILSSKKKALKAHSNKGQKNKKELMPWEKR